MNDNSPSATRYSPLAMLLHWLIALAVIVNWRLAEAAEHAAEAEAEQIMGTHMALGMAMFVLAVVRLAVRHVHKPPPFASSLKPWEVMLARITHGLFYLLLIVLPILGWLAMSAYGAAISMFGWFDWPALPVPPNKGTAEALFEIHHTLGGIMVVLMFLHVLAVIKHTVFDRDGNIFRMLPF
ncbi:MAG: cytochrome b, partial [Novosphingobium sp.]|nr:cytochrome b [Novosphingobium sp.]